MGSLSLCSPDTPPPSRSPARPPLDSVNIPRPLHVADEEEDRNGHRSSNIVTALPLPVSIPQHAPVRSVSQVDRLVSEGDGTLLSSSFVQESLCASARIPAHAAISSSSAPPPAANLRTATFTPETVLALQHALAKPLVSAAASSADPVDIVLASAWPRTSVIITGRPLPSAGAADGYANTKAYGEMGAAEEHRLGEMECKGKQRVLYDVGYDVEDGDEEVEDTTRVEQDAGRRANAAAEHSAANSELSLSFSQAHVELDDLQPAYNVKSNEGDLRPGEDSDMSDGASKDDVEDSPAGMLYHGHWPLPHHPNKVNGPTVFVGSFYLLADDLQARQRDWIGCLKRQAPPTTPRLPRCRFNYGDINATPCPPARDPRKCVFPSRYAHVTPSLVVAPLDEDVMFDSSLGKDEDGLAHLTTSGSPLVPYLPKGPKVRNIRSRLRVHRLEGDVLKKRDISDKEDDDGEERPGKRARIFNRRGAPSQKKNPRIDASVHKGTEESAGAKRVRNEMVINDNKDGAGNVNHAHIFDTENHFDDACDLEEANSIRRLTTLQAASSAVVSLSFVSSVLTSQHAQSLRPSSTLSSVPVTDDSKDHAARKSAFASPDVPDVTLSDPLPSSEAVSSSGQVLVVQEVRKVACKRGRDKDEEEHAGAAPAAKRPKVQKGKMGKIDKSAAREANATKPVQVPPRRILDGWRNELDKTRKLRKLTQKLEKTVVGIFTILKKLRIDKTTYDGLLKSGVFKSINHIRTNKEKTRFKEEAEVVWQDWKEQWDLDSENILL